MASRQVFVSVGRTASLRQEMFAREVESFLRERGYTPRTVGRTDFSYQEPLKKIVQVMAECSGTIVIALERFHIHRGTEFRGSDGEIELEEVNLPTVWNQIEATMAYMLGHPLLAIVDAKLRSEGLLETGYDWYVKLVDLDPASLSSQEFLKTFHAWENQVAEYGQ
jgi:hypothetical protein